MPSKHRSPYRPLELAIICLYLIAQISLLLTEQYALVGVLFVLALLTVIKYELRPRGTGIRRQVAISRYRRLKANGGQHTEAEWERLKRRYSYKCVKCQRRGLELTKDHIIPVSLGGSDDITNLQPLCQSCNSSKGTKIADYR